MLGGAAMVKGRDTTRRAQIAADKKSGKAAARKRVAARKNPAAELPLQKLRSSASATMLAPSPNKTTTVIVCVNSYMDVYHSGWNADLQGDLRKLVDDFHETPSLFLDAINDCLERHGLSIYPVPQQLVQTCATATIGQIKYAINLAAHAKS
jgi:hypothetical protein